MVEAEVTLQEMHLDGPEWVGGSIPRPARLVMRPGQYLLGYAPGRPEPIPTALFPSQLTDETIRLAPSLPPAWAPGMALKVRGALGHGFHLPELAQRVALIALGAHPFRLLPLLAAALAKHAEVVLCAAVTPSWLPPAVEVLEPQAIPEAAAWANYIAFDLEPGQISTITRRTRLKQVQNLPAEVLVYNDSPCGGAAECGVCALKTRAGWKLACKDGPVFPIKDLEI